MGENHLTVGVYPNGSFVCNVVRDGDIKSHIEYNKTFRFGRLLYVDGARVHNGCLKEECLHKYDKIAKDIFDNNTINMNHPTIPYR